MLFQQGFNPLDPLQFSQQLSSAELATMNKAKEFAQTYLLPQVTTAFREETLDKSLVKKMGEFGLLGGSVGKQYAGPAMSAVEYGLVARELERVDSGYRTIFSVISSLVMHAIEQFGSEQQKQYYLPQLARGELLTSFGLTEPLHGSDPAGMETQAKKITEGYLLNGHKRWIGLAPLADIFIVWAKDDSGVIRGFLLEKKLPGLVTKYIEGKCALRTAPTGEIILNDVKVPETALLPKSNGLSSVLSCLNNARFSIAWGALGAAEYCLQAALNYSLDRQQFGKPLAANQLIQAKLVEMQVEIALALQACLQVARLADQGQASHQMVSLIKKNSASKALKIARYARDVLGGNGILDEYGVIRHMMNLEAVNTYEGTEDIHTLILGRSLTGLAAFT